MNHIGSSPMPVREPIRPADALREPHMVSAPDPRSDATDSEVELSLRRQHQRIAHFQLSPFVPAPVAIQFETAKNLFLYAWHVYRFYPVAESLALTTLEFGLRERLQGTQAPTSGQKSKRPPTLAPLLVEAVKLGLIRNEGFARWHNSGAQRAIERHRFENLQRMIDEGLSELEFDDADAVVSPEDLDWDLVAILLNTLHMHRNMHAHGSSHLTPAVLGTFELVAKILNQVFST